MQQLDGHDARFLYSDTAHSNANISLLHIYDQSTVPGGKLRFKTILAHIASRLHRSPMLRRRLQRVPLELDYPYWVDDEHFDLEYHVRHIALPRPGDWRQFCIQASRIHARPLDLNRPLWELYVIEGLDSLLHLPPGSFAVLTKIHHAAIDLEHGAQITTVLHDLTATPPPPEPPEPWFPQAGPGRIGMLTRGALGSVSQGLRLAGPLARALKSVAPVWLGSGESPGGSSERLEPTRFNSVVSPHRVFETRRFEMAEFDEIRRLVRGASLNDAVLAVCGGGLRRYLDAAGELPEGGLTAIAPQLLSTGAATPDDESPADSAQWSWRRVQLGTHLDDPVSRLAHIHAQTGAAGRNASADRDAVAGGARELLALAQRAPAATLALASKAMAMAAGGIGRRSPLAHCTITHVPGPGKPLYLCGARMTYFSAIMPISDGMGLVFAVTSYDGKLIISPTSCRELMPDPEAFAQHVRDSFQEYLAIARRKRRAAQRKPAKPAPAARDANDAKDAKDAPRPGRRPRASATGRPTRPARTA